VRLIKGNAASTRVVLSKESAPIVSKAINQIAARFSIPVSEKLAAQSIPIIGAFGGATINLLFTKVSGLIYSMNPCVFVCS
jgi:hypothetical protein